MNRSGLQPVAAALLVMVLIATTVTHAEVSANSAGSRVQLLLIEEVPLGAHTEDPNPVGIVWIPMRPVAQSTLLNPDGGPRGDRRPDSTRLPGSNRPAAVWSYVPGPSAQIAYAEWGGIGWLPTELLTGGSAWNWDPRIHVGADGAIHVVWWEQTGADRVLSRTRPAGSAVWNAAVPVSAPAESARKPAVVTVGDALWVAYERDSALPGVTREVVVAISQNGGAFQRQVVATTSSPEPLEVSIHREAGRLWLVWRHDLEELAHVVRNGSAWPPPAVQAWSNFTWLGLEEMRRSIRRQVLAP